ncbi:MAG: porin [Gallionellaceae bacterium]
MKRNKIMATASVAAFLVVSGAVHANDVSDAVAGAQPVSIAAPASVPTVTGGSDDSLTFHGVTLYGTIDAGYAYQTHGTPFNKDYSSGLEYSIQKNSNKSISAFAPNGLGQSNIGLKGETELVDGLSGIFKLEGGFDPLSLRLANGPASLVSNNGVSPKNQSSNGDSSRAGQIFNSAAYAGVKSKDYGTLTYGRQVTLQADNVIKYDPNTVSCAFSVIGCSSTAQGIGDKQDGRLDSSLKYTESIGGVRVGVLYQFAGKQIEFLGADGVSGSAGELAVGSDFGNFSADLIVSHKNDAISAAALAVPGNSLSATVSDNTSFALMGKYKAGAATWYAGYEHIRFANPSSPLSPGVSDVGGYTLSAVNNVAYTQNKILDWYWAGLKYAVTPKLNLTGTYYGYSQNSYSGNGCANATLTTCSGTFDAESFVATYGLTKHWSVYGGAMWSQAHNGVASGYLYTSTVTTMVGGRLTL